MLFSKQPERPLYDIHDWRVGVVAADLNYEISSSLLDSAVDRAQRLGIKPENITVLHVPGAVDIPLGLQHLARAGGYNALLGIGCEIRGDTLSFDYRCRYVTEGVLRVSLDAHIPVGLGVLMCETKDQASMRRNLGRDHMDEVLDLASALRAHDNTKA